MKGTYQKTEHDEGAELSVLASQLGEGMSSQWEQVSTEKEVPRTKQGQLIKAKEDREMVLGRRKHGKRTWTGSENASILEFQLA